MNAADSTPVVHGDEQTPPTRYAGIAETAQDESAAGIAWLLPRCRWWLTEVEQCPGDAEPGESFCWEHGSRFATVVPFAEITFSRGSVSGGGNTEGSQT